MRKSGIFIFIMMLIAALSCTNESIKVDALKTDRLVFSSDEEFSKTYQLLAKMSTKAEQEQWAKDKNHSTLLNSQDPAIVDYSEALKTILNSDYEFQIGDNTIWFNKGNLYSFSKDQLLNLPELKKNTENYTPYGSVKSLQIESKNNNKTARTEDIGLGWGKLDARNQYPFTQHHYQPCGGTNRSLNGTRKYVHEIYDETITLPGPGPVRTSNLYLRIKLEYKGSSWAPAGEQRQTTVNVSGNFTMTGIGIPNSNFYSIYASNDCYSGNWVIPIATVTHGPYYTEPPHWFISMQGAISHSVKGDDLENAWTNTEWTPGAGVLW